MPAEIKLPVYVRVGETPEAHFGDVTVPVEGDKITVWTYRREMAAFLRAAADALESPTNGEEADGGTP
jgi:hypothetical protein